MVEIRNIFYEVDDKTLLRDVSDIFLPGKLNLIIGPNGAGKSTLIRIISRQLQAESGVVTMNGKNLKDYDTNELARFRAVLSQHTELAFPMPVYEVVMMGRYPHFGGKPSARDKDACEAAMKLFDVTQFADRNYQTLSGGEQQRVQFARVLAQLWYAREHECRYLLLDEPLTFLDVYYQYEFMHQLQALLGKDLCVIGVVHDLNLAARFADHLLLLHHGKVLASGSPSLVLTEANIRAAYHMTPVIHQDNGKMFLLF